ncbi:MAG: NADH:flavin oxidoreductase [Proteobacteria bacterium]|nr:NADH:flavin oxidoreductase [Pseudomonadota bacterium]
MDYPNLTRPLTVKSTTFPNRVVLPPIQTNYAASNGETTERHLNFYANIARNQVGLTIVGATGVSPVSRLGDHAFCLYEDRHVESGRALFAAIKQGGSVPAVQINHGGRVLSPELAGGRVIGPSAIASPAVSNTPRALTTGEVEEIVLQFVRTAENAKKAGAELVELHGAHSFLLNQFLSPVSNQRTDRYGGGTENRARIVREILTGAREKVGADFPIGLRLSVEEYVDGGLGLEESLDMIRMFIEDGLDVVHVSGGGIDSGGRMIKAANKGDLIRLAGEVKKAVSIPVIAVGGVTRLEQAEEAIQAGLADMVAIGRGLIADPELVSKSLAGRSGDVVECNSCLQCFMRGEAPGLTCSLNDKL